MSSFAVAEVPPPIRQVPLHEQARARLRHMIVRGELPPGDNIGEAELCRSLGISRTPLREALKLLAAEGLVELPSNRGAFVAPIRSEEVADAFEVAARLEQLGAELAATRATAADIAALQELQERMEAEHRARRRGPYFEINQQIHRNIVAIGGNQVLIATHEMLFARVERVRYLAIASPLRWDESIQEHREVLAGLAARDPGRAGIALARHVRHTGQRMTDFLEPVAPGEAADLPLAPARPTKQRQTRTRGTS
jgi:DNA-binding GntR family transcriptional regulator